MGWQPAIATNLSYLGVKGTHPLKDDLAFIWQLEAGIDISATPGTKEYDVEQQRHRQRRLVFTQQLCRFRRQRLGRRDDRQVRRRPYKTSTDRLNPFSGMLGDYRVMIGNTGGDNRVEFGLRAAHAIWYESPSLERRLVQGDVLAGQNRDDTSSIVPSAEPDCNGGNIPGSGALPPTCNDGSFGEPVQRQRSDIWVAPLSDCRLRDA